MELNYHFLNIKKRNGQWYYIIATIATAIATATSCVILGLQNRKEATN